MARLSRDSCPGINDSAALRKRRPAPLSIDIVGGPTLNTHEVRPFSARAGVQVSVKHGWFY
jgi:hypothetical protein